MRVIAEGIARAYNVEQTVTYTREFVPLVNQPAQTEAALEAARAVLGAENVSVVSEPFTGSEDFARFLAHVPGCFSFVGNGASAPLHNPRYDFDDAGLIHGARFHAEIVRRRLAVA